MTLQIILSSAASFLVSFAGIFYYIKIANSKKIFQPIRDDGVKSHVENKSKTPTMGGLFIVIAIIVATLIFSNRNQYVLTILAVGASFAVIGLIDDLIKISKSNSKGFKGGVKLILQFIIVATAYLFLQKNSDIYNLTTLNLPFINYQLDLGDLYIIFVLFFVCGMANGVNLTDGLDGLVSIPLILSFICLIIFIMAIFGYHQENIGQIILIFFNVIAAISAFLIFNFKPAKIFMGDVGSLSLGAMFAMSAVILRQEIIFTIIGLLFVIEALSVIIQVASYKIRAKRVFLMAPIHHHFEKKGLSEWQVVLSFWLFSAFCAIIGILSFFI